MATRQKDIEYFRQKRMAGGELTFYRSLPHHIKSSYKIARATGGTFDNLTVLQEWAGPEELSSDRSNSILKPSWGIQEIKFWYGLSKHMNWIPVSGTIFLAYQRLVNEKWQHAYFDEETGKLLTMERNEAGTMREKNKLSKEYYSKGVKEVKSNNLENAMVEFQNAFASASTDKYKNKGQDGIKRLKDKMATIHKQKGIEFLNEKSCMAIEAMCEFEKARDIASSDEVKKDCQTYISGIKMSVSYKDGGMSNFIQKKYQEAIDEFKKAQDIAPSESLKNDCIKLIESTEKNWKDEVSKSHHEKGQIFKLQEQYQEAIDEFVKARDSASSESFKDINQVYIDKAKMAQVHFLLLTLWKEAWMLENDDKTHEANEKFQFVLNKAREGLQLFNNDESIQKYETLAHLKIEGSLLFNEGLQLQARKKLEKSKEQFSSALQKFKEGLERGDENFQKSVDIVEKSLDTLKIVSGNDFMKSKLVEIHSLLPLLWKEAWKLENIGKSQEAKERFNLVLIKAREGLQLSSIDEKIKKYEMMAELKIEGNDLFNEGLQLLEAGYSFFDEAKDLKRQLKNDETGKKVKEAEEKLSCALKKFKNGFDRGDRRFKACIEIAGESIETIHDILDDNDSLLTSSLDIFFSDSSSVFTDDVSRDFASITATNSFLN